jgi:hypothetical protein
MIDIKHEVVEEMEHLLNSFTELLAVLDALDRYTGSSGAYDLHDQLVTLTRSSESLAACLKRIRLIIPTTTDIDDLLDLTATN